jgi:hypothetical protein
MPTVLQEAPVFDRVTGPVNDMPAPFQPYQSAIIGSGPGAIAYHRSLFESLRFGVQNIGTVASFLGRYIPGLAPVAPLVMLSGLDRQPQPGLYGIPEGGTPEWRAKWGLSDPVVKDAKWQRRRQYTLMGQRVRR